ncbi:MAG: acetolactate synthase small subunit [Deltaproteobacteria bacterium]|nr:acetolactate synthase small subunit [Deltaproteobacteria bacterium]
MHPHTLSVLVENEFGVLARVAGMFAARGYNIDSLSVAPTHDPKYSHMTIVTSGSEEIIEQIKKQLYRLMDTIQVKDLTGSKFLQRETLLVKVNAYTVGEETINEKDLGVVIQDFQAKCLDESPRSKTFELTASPEQLAQFLEKLNPFGVIEVVRTGIIAMQKGDV